MILHSTNIYIYFSDKKMAAILFNEENGQHYCQVIPFGCMEIENNQIDTSKCIGPFETFKICCDNVKENYEDLSSRAS